MLKVPKLRFNTGWRNMGAVVSEKDTRTTKELLDTIEFLANKSDKNVQNLLPEIKKMNPKYLGLVSDTLEFANSHTMLFKKTNLNDRLPNGQTVLSMLLPKVVSASKTEHKALDFAMDVINNTDQTASERFLTELSLSNVLENPKFSEKFDSARLMVKEIAENTLKPPYFINNSLDDFIQFIKILTSKDVKADKVKMFKSFADFVSNIFSTDKPINVPRFVESDVPPEKILDNMQTLSKMAGNIEKQNPNIDVVDFVIKNTNLK